MPPAPPAPPAAAPLSGALQADQAARRAALNPSASLWLSASAGSGKTAVLVERLLALLLDGAAPESLLCLTFTRAAAAEMFARLAERLLLWAVDTELRGRELARILGPLPREEMREMDARAARLFFDALDAPGGVRIRTLHGFCQELLARFPLEAGVPPGFRVWDEGREAGARAAAGRAVAASLFPSAPGADASPDAGADSNDGLAGALAAALAYGGEEGLNGAVAALWRKQGLPRLHPAPAAGAPAAPRSRRCAARLGGGRLGGGRAKLGRGPRLGPRLLPRPR